MRYLISPAGVVGVAVLALALHAAMFGGIKPLAKLANRDDWAGVRDRASRLSDRPSRWQPGRVGLALYFLGLAQLVLGDLRAAERSLERAVSQRLPDAVRAAVRRQLASVAWMAGRSDEALALLAEPATRDPHDAYSWHTHRALVLLYRDDVEGAAAEARTAVELLEERLEAVHTPDMRAALTADQVVARSVLLRALVRSGDVPAAVEQWDEHLRRHGSDRPYVRGTLAEAGAELAHARGDDAAARALSATARSHFEEVGAQVDLARSDVFVARLDRDRSALASAEQRLITLGAAGFLSEVELARREIDRAG